MKPFTYVHAGSEEEALAAAGKGEARFIAGGTTLVDLMRLEVMRPAVLIDITGLPLAGVEEVAGGVHIGAMARNSDVAYHPLIVRRYPALSQALRSGASPQLRNMATVGGNLLQRTRCPYFRDLVTPCNKREPGSGCSAIGGFTRSHAVLGVSDRCIATHPSDMCVALVALDAVVHTRGTAGKRAIPIAEFHTLPGDRPEIENVLQPGELVTHVELPASRLAARSRYLKVRDRESFAFALASAAVALDLHESGNERENERGSERGSERGRRIRGARVALGGVATKPWRSREAERALVGQPATEDTFRRAAAAALEGARPQPDNRFKIELASRTIARALALAAGGGS